MANVNLNWVLPTVRESGKPLDPATITKIEIAISADAGANYTVTDEFPKEVLSTVFTDVEPGTWNFRGVVVDTDGRRSKPKFAAVTVPDTSPPGELVSLVATLA